MRERAHAQKVLQELTELDDPFQALEEITFWLKSISECPDLDWKDRVALFLSLEAGSNTWWQRTFDIYRKDCLEEKFNAASWWLTVSFWEQLALNGGLCLEYYEKNSTNPALAQSPVTKEIPYLIIRTLQAIHGQIRMLYRQYCPISTRVWRLAFRTFSLAEKYRISGTEYPVLSSQGLKTSPLRELLKILVLSISNLETLTFLQMEIVFLLIDYYADRFTIQSRLSDSAPFIIDLASGTGPTQVMRAEKIQASTRFFGVGASSRLIADLQLKSEYGNLPLEYSFLSKYAFADVYQVSQHLSQNWSPQNSQRKHARSQAEIQILIVNGLPDLFTILAPGSADSVRHQWQSDKASHSVPRVSTWLVDNISESGLGLIPTGQTESWVKVGALVGFSFSGSGHWGIGILRRIGRDSLFRVYVGAKIVAKDPVLASLHPNSEIPSTTPGKISTVILLTQFESDRSQNLYILCDPSAVEIGKTYLLRDGVMEKRVRVEDIRERGINFLCVHLSPF